MKHGMKYYGLLWLCVISIIPSQARDPFNVNERKNTHSARPTNSLSVNLNCHPEAEVYAETIAFEQLRLIGVLVEKNQAQALFSDPDQQVFSVKQGGFLASERLKIEKITTQNVELAQWKQSCDKADKINLKL